VGHPARPIAWHPVRGDMCPCCFHYGAIEWKSSEGHNVVYQGEGQWKGYAPSGTRVMKDHFFDSHEEAFAKCIELSTQKETAT